MCPGRLQADEESKSAFLYMIRYRRFMVDAAITVCYGW